jgi:hypothetical protein
MEVEKMKKGIFSITTTTPTQWYQGTWTATKTSK